MKRKKGFTLIEILVIVVIIAILATVILTMLGQAKKNARINSAKSSLKSSLSAIVMCNDSGSIVSSPVAGNPVCASSPNSLWPELPGGYAYMAGGNYDEGCSFHVNTNGDTPTDLLCTCASQLCVY